MTIETRYGGKCIIGPTCPRHGSGASRRTVGGDMEYAIAARPRKARTARALQQAARDAHSANAVNHELELLTSAAQRVIDEARRIESRPSTTAGRSSRTASVAAVS